MSHDMSVTHLSFEDLVARLEAILERHGCSRDVARQLAENCAAAEPDGAEMIDVRGRIQREEEVVLLVAHSLTDVSKEFASVGHQGWTTLSPMWRP